MPIIAWFVQVTLVSHQSTGLGAHKKHTVPPSERSRHSKVNSKATTEGAPG
eukprot:m.445760 g.445760  ORF g.445760 m.445760 type:complete len:51 (-) comp145385_c0_seq1:96-248(-)